MPVGDNTTYTDEDTAYYKKEKTYQHRIKVYYANDRKETDPICSGTITLKNYVSTFGNCKVTSLKFESSGKCVFQERDADNDNRRVLCFFLGRTEGYDW